MLAIHIIVQVLGYLPTTMKLSQSWTAVLPDLYADLFHLHTPSSADKKYHSKLPNKQVRVGPFYTF